MSEPTLVAARLEQWFTGRATSHLSMVMSETDLDSLQGAPCDVAIVPRGTWVGPQVREVIEYDGRFDESGDELVVADQPVELVDYVAAPFVEPVGPTVVRFADRYGWQAFIADTDLARSTGVLPDHLCSPALLLADTCALSSPRDAPELTRLQIWADGRMTHGMQGDLTALAGEPHPTTAVASIGGVVPPSTALPELESRPWVGLLIAAVEVARLSRLDPALFRVVGLSESVSESSEVLSLRHETHILMRVDRDYVLSDRTSRRRYRLDRCAAVVAEVLLESLPLESEQERCARRLDISLSMAHRVLAEFRSRVRWST